MILHIIMRPQRFNNNRLSVTLQAYNKTVNYILHVNFRVVLTHSDIYMIVRAIAFMFIHTQHASEIAENSVALLVKIKLKYVQFGADCGLRPVACGKV